MTISPLPRHGGIVPERDRDRRSLRVSSHVEAGRVVLSIWQDATCQATFRLAPEDVPDVVAMLTRAAIVPDTSGRTGALAG